MTQTQTHLGLGPSWGLKLLEEGLENLGLGPSWGPESLEEESSLARAWQLKEEKIFSCSYENFMLRHDDVCLI